MNYQNPSKMKTLSLDSFTSEFYQTLKEGKKTTLYKSCQKIEEVVILSISFYEARITRIPNLKDPRNDPKNYKPVPTMNL